MGQSTTTFPTTIDSFGLKTKTDLVTKDETNWQSAAITAIENKLGVDGSAGTTSIDYILSGVPPAQKALTAYGTAAITGDCTVSGAAAVTGNLSTSSGFSVTGTTTLTDLNAVSVLGTTSVTNINATIAYQVNGTSGITATHPMSSGSTLVIANGLIVAVV